MRIKSIAADYDVFGALDRIIGNNPHLEPHRAREADRRTGDLLDGRRPGQLDVGYSEEAFELDFVRIMVAADQNCDGVRLC